jgi:hypothetical protein
MNGGTTEYPEYSTYRYSNKVLELSTSALVDLPGSGSTGQLIHFGLTQICGNTCIQVLAPTGQVPVKRQILTDILSIFRSSQYSQVLTSAYQHLSCKHGQFILLIMQNSVY